MLRGKRVLLGVSASIAAYKAAFLTRLLVKEGAEVRVIMTPASHTFVTPQTLSTLSKNAVLTTFFPEDDPNSLWNNHVDLGLWADIMLIAPASSNTMGKMATGICDNLLLATYMSAKCPVFVAPAMDLDMYLNAATKNNIHILQQAGCTIIDAEHGELASGLIGQGRMAEPEHIVAYINNYLLARAPLRGKKVLINAGPTYEKIDAVRFIGNFSTGKMGVALAQKALQMGAEVHLVLGPVQLPFDLKGIEETRVVSAVEMLHATLEAFSDADITILTAAVADYRPVTSADKKLKKTDNNLTIELEPTADILAACGKLKRNNQLLVGFALETNDELNYAKDKLARKNLDFIVMNSLRDAGAGFGHDTNKITVVSKAGVVNTTPLLSKNEIAEEIFKVILKKG